MDKCKHPEDQREPYHDMTVKCCACNCVIEQFGKPIDPPSPLSPKIWPVESSREPAGYSSDFAAGFRVARGMAVDAVASVRNQTRLGDDINQRLNKAVAAAASIKMPEDE